MSKLGKTMLLAGLVALPLTGSPAVSQGMPPEQIKQILDVTKTSWVSFRDWNGQQLIYFTHLESWRCGIDFVFYSLNSTDLDQMWELDACDPSNPNAVLKEKPYIELPANSTQSITVQLIFKDGTKSSGETFYYKP
ncbi:hypothetical protein [Labrenzia sp. PHM005]|uniref:hypothetical protein n=1 Tax=Labrenzia sp. PHM005 TaxID=2590016 RepID=UPI00113FEB9F|nr:hypothetical protein [Labrenzia sp. PHM005]QDG76763.1 hypothetical protein FJ695_13245 [Labrenzia sp. PHM005]